MLRTPLAKAYIKRTLRKLYANHQSTPVDSLLDPAWGKTVDIYPGMAAMRINNTSGGSEYVTLLDATGIPFGLFGQYVAPTYGIDELADSGVNSIAVWVLNTDAEFEVKAPAFDPAATWVYPTNGTDALVHAYTSGASRGVLCPAGAALASTKPVARLVSRPATDTLIIRGLGAPGSY